MMNDQYEKEGTRRRSRSKTKMKEKDENEGARQRRRSKTNMKELHKMWKQDEDGGARRK